VVCDGKSDEEQASRRAELLAHVKKVMDPSYEQQEDIHLHFIKYDYNTKTGEPCVFQDDVYKNACAGYKVTCA